VSGIRIDDELGVGQPLRQDNCVHGRDDEVMAPAGGGNRDGGELFVWDIHSGERMRVLLGDCGIVYAVAWSPTGTVLVSGGSDGMLSWWDVEREECVRVRRAHQGSVQCLRVSPDGSRLASCGDHGAITLWNLHSGEYFRTLRRDRPYERLDISGVKVLTQAQKASLRALGAIEIVPVTDIQDAP
jgi:WD40 repeat protein